MTPEMWQTIYVFDKDLAIANATREHVGYLGRDSFIVGKPQGKKTIEYFYDDYMKTWFPTLREAKKALKEFYGDGIILHRADKRIGLWLDRRYC